MIYLERAYNLSQPRAITELDDKLNQLEFRVANKGLHFEKRYSSPHSTLVLHAVCSPDRLFDLPAYLTFKEPPLNIKASLDAAEKIIRKNVTALFSLGMVKQSQLSTPGGSGGLTNINLDEGLGGPRWWLYSDQESDMKDLEKKIQDQYRYHPEYMSTSPEAPTPPSRIIGYLPTNISGWELQRDRAKSRIEYTLPDGSKNYITPPQLEEINTNPNNYKVELASSQDPGWLSVVLQQKQSQGSARGIWDVNGKPSVPGFGYIWDDQTSLSQRPFLDSNEMGEGRDWYLGWPRNY